MIGHLEVERNKPQVSERTAEASPDLILNAAN